MTKIYCCRREIKAEYPTFIFFNHLGDSTRLPFHVEIIWRGGARLFARPAAAEIMGRSSSSDDIMQSIAPAAPIPDILLSQAKDDRYISEVSSLLSQIASVCLFPLFSDRRRSSSSGSGAPYTATPVTTSTGGDDEDDDDNHGKHHFIHRILPELNLLASIIVHSSAFICYNRATGNGTVQQSTLGMESLNLVSHRDIATWKKRERSSSSNISSILHSVRDRFMEVCSPSSWNVNHFQFFIFLQTIVPYILQRVHRGGWLEDLRGLIPVNRSERINDIGEEERVLRNDERLRGSARRRLFDEQRRQMLQSFSSTQTNAHGSHGGDSVNESTNPSNDIANLVDTDQSVHNGRLPKKIATLSWNAIRVSDKQAVSILYILPKHR
jgi:hypothetical protein